MTRPNPDDTFVTAAWQDLGIEVAAFNKEGMMDLSLAHLQGGPNKHGDFVILINVPDLPPDTETIRILFKGLCEEDEE